ncbi:hypothetical protein TcBrA4_0123860 [Trypanosoma cruzi]|nr:hypothetical protein TcBrA4_0123860 [Trypanosoma cruzi]
MRATQEELQSQLREACRGQEKLELVEEEESEALTAALGEASGKLEAEELQRQLDAFADRRTNCDCS